ncbi:MAG: D-glycero-beta-D-manno-heptose 1,7-bisphosphate 7-phosphatase [Burkholderiales bacterium]|nr:D-glycero-beta-D-manno-heptose 1,7-bisphosphate 7-phosphatase [Burkholderiales bacterium]
MHSELDSSSVRQRAVFLDRDGVINVNHGYVHHSDDFEFIDGIFDVARSAHASGYKLIVITNQSGIGRGYYSEEQFHQLTAWMCNEFLNADAPIEKVYFSPFHPTAGLGAYKKDDVSRKPRPGMIQQAQREMNLDLENSILIGDKASDIHAGIAAGVGLNILFVHNQHPELSGLSCQTITNLREALPFINSSC